MTRGAVLVAATLAATTAAAGPAATVDKAGAAATTAPRPGPAPIDLPETPAVITVPAPWRPSVLPEVEARPVAAYESPAGGRVVITRANAHNPEAWIERYRERYADRVETGLAAAAEGYKRRARTVLKVNGVPCMDLQISRIVDGAREDVALRFVFFRTYTLTAVAVGPKKDKAAIAAILRSFGPPKGYIP